MKYVFLDIDGVLNSHIRTCNGYASIERENVEQFNRLLGRFPHMKIVLSSAWRYMVLDNSMTLKGFERLLLSHRVDCFGKLFDLLPPDENPEECFPGFFDRGTLINNWIAARPDCTPEECLVLDDLRMLFLNEAVLYHQTDPHTGLTEEDVQKIFLRACNAKEQPTER